MRTVIPAAARCARRLRNKALPGVDPNNWYALFAPAKTPPAVVDSLNPAVRRALTTPTGVREALPAASSPQELAALLKRDTEKWAKLIRAKGIQGE